MSKAILLTSLVILFIPSLSVCMEESEIGMVSLDEENPETFHQEKSSSGASSISTKLKEIAKSAKGMCSLVIFLGKLIVTRKTMGSF